MSGGWTSFSRTGFLLSSWLLPLAVSILIGKCLYHDDPARLSLQPAATAYAILFLSVLEGRVPYTALRRPKLLKFWGSFNWPKSDTRKP